MKFILKTATAAILALAACLEVNQAPAQSLLAGWSTTGYPVNSSETWPVTTANANLTIGDLTKGSGIGIVNTANVFGGNAWTNSGLADSEASSISHGLYITWTVQASAGYTISFTTNVYYYHNSATGPWTGELQYSTDGVNYTDVASLAYSSQPNPAGVAQTLLLTNNLSGVAALQNVPSTTMNYFRLVNWGAYGATGTWYIDNGAPNGQDGLQIIGNVTSPGIAPTITGIAPSSVTAGFGSTVNYTVTATGDPPSYFWYQGPSGAGTLLPTQTSATLTLTNVSGANAGSYYVVLSNATPPMATSSVVTLSVIDPYFTFPPNNAEGFLGGQVQFAAAAAGTSPSYAWYQNNGTGNWTLMTNGVQPSGSSVSGQGTTNIVISNVQYADSNNFAFVEAIASDGYGMNTSPVASLLNVSSNAGSLASYVFNGVGELLGIQDGLPNSGIIAQWDFNGLNFTNPLLNPPPYTGIFNPAAPAVFFPPPWIGVGSATAVGCAFAPGGGPSGISPFNGALASAVDGAGYSTNLPNGSFGTENYPLVGSNKLNGVQFMTSTVGAKNINVSYYLRETGTSSEYTRLQYTTNSGTDWTDYPTSSSFPGSDVNLYAPIFAYDLSGFPGVANNPEFGIQVVTEFQSTATYGLGSQPGNPLFITNGYVGADNLYSSGSLPAGAPTSSAGTMTFDLVTIGGQPMNETIYSPPTISEITNENVISAINTVTDNSVATGESNYDFVQITNAFTIGSAITPVSGLVVTAQSLNPNKVYGNFAFSASGANITMVMTPFPIPDPLDAAPILVTVTDTNSGDTTVEWFLLTLQSLNLPPTNSLVFLSSTNMLANSTLNLPFTTGSYDGTNTSPPVSYVTNSGNNSVIPIGNLGLTGQGTTNLVFSITPASNQLGEGVVSVTVFDGNPIEPRFTTATIPVMVRPNTNIILLDYFSYDASGALETVSAGYWSHLTGNENQVQVGNEPVPNSVTIDSVDYTETLQAPLLGAPYMTNASVAKTLYASYIITLNALPVANGGYITAFNDGTGNAGGSVNRLECGLWVETNTAATPNHYQIGIGNYPVQEGSPGATFSQDLSVGTSYVVVTALNVSNGLSTLWVNPVDQSSPSVTDISSATGAGATNIAVSDYTLHEGTGGAVSPTSISKLKVGTTFDSVFPSLHIQAVGTNAILTWSDPTLNLQYSPDLVTPWVDITGATSPYTNAMGTNTEMYFKFGQ